MSKHQIGYIFFILFSLTYAFGIFYFNWSFIYYIPFFILWFSVLIYGSFTIGSNYHLEAVSKIKANENLVAITFDDGPSEFTPAVLDLLDKYEAKASFFCIGKQVEKYPEILKTVYDKGHTIGNHTFTHSKVGFQSVEKTLEEIRKTETAIEEITGEQTKYFRPPFGVTNPSIKRAVDITGHGVIGWNIRSIDTAIKDQEKVLNRIKKRLKSGSIILLHDTSEHSVLILEQLLLYLREKDYKPVSIDELLKLEK